MEKIWYLDIKHLFTEKNYNHFFPSKDMTFAEQLNALLRLSIYFSLFVFVLRKDSNIFMIPIFVGLFTYFIYSVDTDNKTNETMYLNQQNWDKNPNTEELCVKPTENNPFMNVLMNEYSENPTRKKACDISRSDIKRQSQKFFDKKLYRSVSDIFNKESSDREFITNPITTIPNDAKSFSEWCWGQGRTCKEGNGQKCYSNQFRHIET
jgi:hypothetical protein